MADVTADLGTVGERYHFLIRRLHSLSGIIPVGVFLCIHLSVNATIMAGCTMTMMPRFDTEGVLKIIQRDRVTIVAAGTGKPNAMVTIHMSTVRKLISALKARKLRCVR